MSVSYWDSGLNGSSDTDLNRRKLGDCGSSRLDFISKLPDSLLLEILSLLPVRDVVPTTILSKRWDRLWTYVPVLNICLDSDVERLTRNMDLESLRRFISSVNHALRLHQSPKFDKFNVSMSNLTIDSPHVDVRHVWKSLSRNVDSWLRFALRKDVQELKMYMELDSCSTSYSEYRHQYMLPLFLFNSSSLVILNVSNCCFGEDRELVIKWKLLKVLSIKLASLSNNLIQNFFASCPFLESLELYDCQGFNYIESNSLRNLVVNNYNLMADYFDIEDALRISAPYLQSLEISEDLGAHRLCLINSSVSLVNANISFNMENNESVSERPRQIFTRNLQELLEKIRHVKYLTVGSWCLQVLSASEEKALFFPFSNVVSLTLHTRLNKRDRLGIKRLLVLLPLLDTLVVDRNGAGSVAQVFHEEFLESEGANGGNCWESRKFPLEGTLQNLKTVKIVDFKGSEDQMEFIAYMLNNAKRLQKMIIQRRKLRAAAPRPFDGTHIAERLLNFPRCSSSAVISFY